MAHQRAQLGVAGVGVGIEVDHRQPAPADMVGHAGGVGEGNGVVAAQDHGDGPGPGHRFDGSLETGDGRIGVTGGHDHIADVDHPELDQGVDAETQVGAAPVMGQVVGEADGLGSEAGAGPVRGTTVEGGTDDDRPGAGVGGRFGQVGARNTDERGGGAIQVAHRRSPPCSVMTRVAALGQGVGCPQPDVAGPTTQTSASRVPRDVFRADCLKLTAPLSMSTMLPSTMSRSVTAATWPP